MTDGTWLNLCRFAHFLDLHDLWVDRRVPDKVEHCRLRFKDWVLTDTDRQLPISMRLGATTILTI
jgi:hypothetical protein